MHYKHIFKRSTFGGVIFVSKMRGFGLVVSEVKTIWIKLYGHSANVPHVLGISVDFCRWERRFKCLTIGSSTSLKKCILLQICEILSQSFAKQNCLDKVVLPQRECYACVLGMCQFLQGGVKVYGLNNGDLYEEFKIPH